jgi:hypothetical protein
MIHTVTYLCPSCEHRIDRDIDYPDNFTDPKEGFIVISTWCSRCNSIHKYNISINPLKHDKYRVSTKYFFCDGEKVTRRLNFKKE